MLLHALATVPDGLLQRRLNLKRRLLVDPAKTVVFAAVAIWLAATGFGVWSLVIGTYASMLVWVTGTWLLARWRPGRTRPSYRLWREMARYAFPLLVLSLVGRTQTALETALVGRQLREDSLGQYRYAERLDAARDRGH